MSAEAGNADAFLELGVVKDRTFYDVVFTLAVKDITGVKHIIRKNVVLVVDLHNPIYTKAPNIRSTVGSYLNCK